MQYSLQLYSVVHAMEKDFKETVRHTAQIGYDGVEFAGFYDMNAADITQLLTENKLYCHSSHCSVDQFGDAFDKTLAFHREIGCKYIILPYYSFSSSKDIDKVVQLLNDAAEQAAPYGIKIGYHNHQHEFESIDGKRILDEIAARTCENVVIQLDVFWAAYAGIDPIAWIKKWGKKVEMIHLKQIDSNKENVDFPDGILDMKAMINAAAYAKEFTVEHERPEDEDAVIWKSVQRNIEYLKELNL